VFGAGGRSKAWRPCGSLLADANSTDVVADAAVPQSMRARIMGMVTAEPTAAGVIVTNTGDRAITDVYLWPGSVLIKQEIQGGGMAEIETSGQFSSVKYNDSTGAMCEIAL